jgi:sigma-B regulation protein RsbU (phosphoserine phosphatase)
VLAVEVARDREGRSLEAGDLRVPASVIERALNSRRELLSMIFDPLEESGARPESTVAALELRSVVCLPLIEIRSGKMEETGALETARATVGLVYMDSREIAADLSAGNRELLQTLAIEASTILENARLIEEERIKQRMEDELKIAREIQQGLTPPALPTSGWFRAAGSSWASSEVGGDYFDVSPLPGDRWAAVVADVSGKGVSSALLASFLQGAFLMASGGQAGIGAMMGQLNRFLLERTRGEKYATVFYCIVEASGKLYYVNAGHCAPYLVSRDGRLRKLHTTGMPVGMLEEAEFQMVETQLEPGDKIALYSDGLTEAEDANGHFFDAERVRLCLREFSEAGAVQLHRRLMDTVEQFTEGGVVRDDITALVLEYAGPA